MEPRHTDQDVAALYCAIRDAIASAPALTWRERLRDLFAPGRAARRRTALIAAVYAQWQEARPLPRIAAEAPLPMQGTVLAQMMVREDLARLRAGALPAR